MNVKVTVSSTCREFAAHTPHMGVKYTINHLYICDYFLKLN